MNIHLNPSLLKFGEMTVINSNGPVDSIGIVNRFDLADTQPYAVTDSDTQPLAPVSVDDTATFERTEVEPVYLKLPIPAFIVRLWIRFDEFWGVVYR